MVVDRVAAHAIIRRLNLPFLTSFRKTFKNLTPSTIKNQKNVSTLVGFDFNAGETPTIFQRFKCAWCGEAVHGRGAWRVWKPL
ncbi:hypothetical protein V6Z11_A03G156900 [Gossypium hirsutum]